MINGFSWTLFGLFGVGVICLALYGCPKWNVYQANLAGKAQLAQAEGNRQIKILEAKATKESAIFLAEAEVERAKGVAAANDIIMQRLGGPEGYLRYLYITALQENKDKAVYYIPTEAGLPILEAGKRP